MLRYVRLKLEFAECLTFLRVLLISCSARLGITGLLAIVFITSSGQTYSPVQKESHGAFRVTNNARLKSEEGEKRYIIKLRQPDSETLSSGRTAASTTVEDQHKVFLDQINRIQSNKSNARSKPLQVNYEFSKAFNGFAISMDESTKNEIAQLKDVDYIIEDQQVEAHDLASSKLISADKVWSEIGATGKGTTIGIIDTGIDYNHPDLGGGLGTNFKVKGGYDFVNNDPDPFDDNGHGTHVAGIAAANGPGLKGVAPDASLYAFKALNGSGSGYDSWILASIERALDPDNNPSTDDKVDVVNMSLGRPIGSYDPISEAVNNAIAQGVTFVVSAGNTYDYGTIGTPAVAQRAITVAATDSQDKTADFSSKGPTSGTYLIKPDVAAPGVQIYSSTPGNTYTKLNGTSMASPHVAGAVALLLEKNPAWAPDIIKSVLMGTAQNPNNELIWHQGAGRIDVRKAIESKFAISPSSISLSISNLNNPVWNPKQTLKIRNLSPETRTFTLTFEGEAIGQGIGIVVKPSSFTLAPSATTDVEVSFSVNVTTLPFKVYPNAYSGVIKASSGKESMRIPYAFVHARQTAITFTGQLPYKLYAIGKNKTQFLRAFTPQESILAMLPDGIYDLIAYYPGNRFVIKENVSSGNDNIVFDPNQAVNTVVFTPKDKAGKSLPFNNDAIGTAFITNFSKSFILYYDTPVDTFHISNQNSYGFDVKYFGTNDFENYYDITVTTGYGISRDLTLTNDSKSFNELNIRNPSVTSGKKQKLTYYTRCVLGLNVSNEKPLLVKNPLRVFASKNSSSGILGSIASFAPEDGAAGYTWETQLISPGSNKSITYSDFQGNKFASINESTIDYTLGSTIPHLNVRIENTENKIVLFDNYKFGVFNRFYGEREDGVVKYTLQQGESVVKSGNIPNRMINDFGDELLTTPNLELETEPALHKLTLKYNDYKLYEIFGEISASLSFNTREIDKNPPSVTDVTLEVESKQTNIIKKGQTGSIKFSARDCGFPGCYDFNAFSELSLFIKEHAVEEWKKISVSEAGLNVFKSVIPTDLNEGYYDLKIVAVDHAKNALEYLVSPAFVFGDAENIPYKKIELIAPLSGQVSIRKPTFKWSYLEEAESYLLEISSTSDFQNAESLLVTKASVFEYPRLLEKSTQYFWRVKARFQSGETPWSETNSFFSDGDEWKQIHLLTPIDNAIVNPESVFKWSGISATSYTVEVSDNNAFDDLVFSTESADTTTLVELNPGKKYYWRVKAPATPRAWSTVNSFEIPAPEILLESPAANGEVSYSTTFKWKEVESAKEYIIALSRDAEFSKDVIEVRSTTNSLSYNLSPNTTYYWKVGASFKDVTVWSSPSMFKTKREQVSLISPVQGSTEQPLSVVFSWSHEISSEYTLQLSTDSTFKQISKSFDVKDSAVAVSELTYNTAYFWRVKPKNMDAIWSSVNNFKTIASLQLISPNNHQIDVELSTLLDWEPMEGAVNYTLEVFKDAEMKHVILRKTIKETSYTLRDLSPYSLYFWRVVADISSSQVFSDLYSFRTLLLTGVGEPIVTNVTAYPNPSSGPTTISFNVAKKSKVQVYIADATGKYVFESDLNLVEGETVLQWGGCDVKNNPLPAGIYIALVKGDSFNVPIKILLQH